MTTDAPIPPVVRQATETIVTETGEIARLQGGILAAQGRWMEAQRAERTAFIQFTDLFAELQQHVVAMHAAKMLLINEQMRINRLLVGAPPATDA